MSPPISTRADPKRRAPGRRITGAANLRLASAYQDSGPRQGCFYVWGKEGERLATEYIRTGRKIHCRLSSGTRADYEHGAESPDDN